MRIMSALRFNYLHADATLNTWRSDLGNNCYILAKQTPREPHTRTQTYTYTKWVVEYDFHLASCDINLSGKRRMRPIKMRAMTLIHWWACGKGYNMFDIPNNDKNAISLLF